MSKVSNRFPTLALTAQRIAFIGQSPGERDVERDEPFVGKSGELLSSAMSHVGIVRDRCFIGNVCQERPPGNDFAAFGWEHPSVRAGIDELRLDLELFKPTLVVCLGNEALHLFKEGANSTPPTKKNGAMHIPVYPNAITNWRGSIFEAHAESPAPSVKCIATLHPAAVLREFDLQPYFKFDMARVAAEAKRGAAIDREERLVCIVQSVGQALNLIAIYRASRQIVSFDIEGGCFAVSCVGIANSAFGAAVIPFIRVDGTSVWTESEEIVIWEALRDLLEDRAVPKVLQNGLYDAFVLAWTFGILIRGQIGDTMLAWWELFPELEKSLATQTSILTRQPYYKFERKSDDDAVAWRYCGLDACVTFECWEKLMEMLPAPTSRAVALPHVLAAPNSHDHYRFNLSLLPCVLFMELRGMKWRRDLAKRELATVETKLADYQRQIDNEAAKIDGPLRELRTALESDDEARLVAFLASRVCVKKPMETIYEETTKTFKNGRTKTLRKRIRRAASIRNLVDVESFAKPRYQRALRKAIALWQVGASASDRSRAGNAYSVFAGMLGLAPNVGSTSADGDAQRFLKDVCSLALPKKRIKGRIREDAPETTGQEALVELYATTRDVRVLWLLQMRRLRKQASDLATAVDSDGRIRCSYSLVKETGRLAASKSPTGNGANLQAWAKKLRHLIASDDEASVFAQCDLEGADSWTVAAECAALGDPTMLDDLKAGLKPAKVLLLIASRGAEVNEWPRDRIREELRAMQIDEWTYAAYKASVHGSSYGMGVVTMIRTVLKNSLKALPDDLSQAKPVLFSAQEMRRVQNVFFLRYPGVRLWHEKTARVLLGAGELVTSCGHRRRFYGRKRERKGTQWVANHKTLGDALASLPQFYTTYATKAALWRHWHDLENRRIDGSMRVEPRHTVHDSKVDHFATAERAWAVAKIREWFDNEIAIAGQKVRIPFDGTVGADWAMKGAERL